MELKCPNTQNKYGEICSFAFKNGPAPVHEY